MLCCSFYIYCVSIFIYVMFLFLVWFFYAGILLNEQGRTFESIKGHLQEFRRKVRGDLPNGIKLHVTDVTLG